jgi:hypothetical protein
MTKTDMPELLPCPFCGGKADMRREPCPDGGGYFAFIQCRDCRAKGADTYYSAGNDCPQTYQGRRDAWNARAIAFDADLIEQAISDVIVHDSGSIRDAAEYVCRNLSDTKTADARAALDAQLAEAEARGRRKALEEAKAAFMAHPWSWNRVEIHAKIDALSDAQAREIECVDDDGNPAPAREVTVQEAAQRLLDADDWMPTEAKLAAVKEHVKRDNKTQPVAVANAWRAALRALAQGGQDDG